MRALAIAILAVTSCTPMPPRSVCLRLRHTQVVEGPRAWAPHEAPMARRVRATSCDYSMNADYFASRERGESDQVAAWRMDQAVEAYRAWAKLHSIMAEK